MRSSKTHVNATSERPNSCNAVQWGQSILIGKLCMKTQVKVENHLVFRTVYCVETPQHRFMFTYPWAPGPTSSFSIKVFRSNVATWERYKSQIIDHLVLLLIIKLLLTSCYTLQNDTLLHFLFRCRTDCDIFKGSYIPLIQFWLQFIN